VGDYLKLNSGKSDIINSMIYPIPDLNYPFLGVHWTKTIEGEVILGPNATLAFSRESYHPFNFNPLEFLSILSQKTFWMLWKGAEFRRMAMTQLQISLSKKKFISEAQKLVPSLTIDDVEPGKSGNRPQLVDNQGRMIDDLLMKKKGNALHVLNAVSPGFTCALAFADVLIEELEK
jgi:L-2-hydroxyglutarate oxidase